MASLYDRADTAELNAYARPQKGFYGKAVIRRRVNEAGRLIQELYSYGQHVADARLVETNDEDTTPYLIFSLYEPEYNATATTRRHIRAFAEMVDTNTRYAHAFGNIESATVVVNSYYASGEMQTLCDSEDELGNFGAGQLYDLVEKALHSVPQARAY